MRMWVDPEWRGCGLAGRLLDALESRASGLGYREVYLDTNSSLDEAIAMYERATRIQPRFADAETNLGNALAMQGNYPMAITHYRRAAEIAPERAGNQFNLALALVRSGQLRAAKTELEKTLTIDPQMADARALYSDVLRDLFR
jgi:tetratricopeptide (TPR) repeat protein